MSNTTLKSVVQNKKISDGVGCGIIQADQILLVYWHSPAGYSIQLLMDVEVRPLWAPKTARHSTKHPADSRSA